jgi:hypothetical protein
MTGQSSTPDVRQLFQSAQQAGELTAASIQALSVIDLGAQIQDALGTPAMDITASEVFLVAMLIDDSGSIRFVSGNTEAVRDGHNAVIDALLGSKQDDSILAHCRYLNGTVLYPFRPLAQAVRMDRHNYDPNGGTPLFDETVALLGTVLAKAQEFADNGVPVRTATLILTDGNDQHSAKANAPKVNTIVKDMLKAETHIVAAMGVDDGSTDFTIVFKGMGIPDQWILRPKNTPSEIRKAFAVFSRSAVRASQSAQSFSQTALGGFGTK